MSISIIPEKDSSGNILAPYNHPFSSSAGFRARFLGMKGTATKAVDSQTPTTSNIDKLVDEDRYVNGVRLILNNHEWDDYLHFEIVDKDGVGVSLGWYDQNTFDTVLGGLYVADRFGEEWQLDDSIKTQPDVVVPYPAKIYAGLYIRIVYISTGTVNDVDVNANLYLHKKTV